MNIVLNGQAVQTSIKSLVDFLSTQGIDPDKEGVALAINDCVISKPQWESTVLNDGDVMDVVRPFQGG